MSALINPLSNKTMSSLEIATLTGKEHKNVVRDIKSMFTALNLDVLSFERIYLDQYNRDQTLYLLDKELTTTLVTGYNVKLRHAVIKRWQELEDQQKVSIPNFADPIEAAEAWIIQAKAKRNLEAKLAIAAPKADALDLIADASSVFGVREAAKILKISQTKFVEFLLKYRWVFRETPKGPLQGFARRVEQAYVVQVITKPIEDEYGIARTYPGVKITAKGMARLAVILPKGVTV